ncbi:MAG: cytochrome-c peroxidase [Gammaproteobacteria bacterium]|nr:cytochrome-c peroxidase [Gammaproteobacteria bacterium]MDD9896933.1 cytochrome-c peroxidase [Gammaproteobacteria bacterium]MDD9959290.1 cytochrome-c peroxidase [Gammaproteobacteria bacterium]
MNKRLIVSILLVSVLGLAWWNFFSGPAQSNWTPAQRQLLESLSLSALPKLPEDPSNDVADLEAAAELGHRLYFDARLSSNGVVSCASCHKPELMFTDGLPLAIGVDIGSRHTPSLVGIAYSPWFYWDGRKDSQWAQALAPLEARHEHNIDRLQIARLIFSDENYRQRYEAIFPALTEIPLDPVSASPRGNEAQQSAWDSLSSLQQENINRVFTNIGKSLAAYQRKIIPGRSRFDDYVDNIPASNATASELFSASEVAGLALFLEEAQCITCHNGPLFTNYEFHNTGVLAVNGQLPPMGRYDGIRIAREDPFNCLGPYSDASRSECIELRFARDTNELVGAHKTPTLRNVTDTAPYMHGGQIETLIEVMEHYNEAPVSMLSHNEAKPLGLRPVQLRQLEAFMHTLSAPLASDPKWLTPPTDQ